LVGCRSLLARLALSRWTLNGVGEGFSAKRDRDRHIPTDFKHCVIVPRSLIFLWKVADASELARYMDRCSWTVGNFAAAAIQHSDAAGGKGLGMGSWWIESSPPSHGPNVRSPRGIVLGWWAVRLFLLYVSRQHHGIFSFGPTGDTIGGEGRYQGRSQKAAGCAGPKKWQGLARSWIADYGFNRTYGAMLRWVYGRDPRGRLVQINRAWFASWGISHPGIEFALEDIPALFVARRKPGTGDQSGLGSGTVQRFARGRCAKVETKGLAPGEP